MSLLSYVTLAGLAFAVTLFCYLCIPEVGVCHYELCSSFLPFKHPIRKGHSLRQKVNNSKELQKVHEIDQNHQVPRSQD